VSQTSVEWPVRFNAKYGRPFRVLHVGNVANNAYLNARMQRDIGIEADVLSPDYYHIMGTPEWEECELTGAVTDQYRPRWYELTSSDWRRPSWFVAGPLEDCIDYLLARAAGETVAAERSSRLLDALNGTRRVRIVEWPGFGGALLKRQFLRVLRWACDPVRVRRKLAQLWVHRGSQAAVEPRVIAWAMRILTSLSVGGAHLALAARRLSARGQRADDAFDLRARTLVADFASAFPSRADQLSRSDLVQFKPVLGKLERLFACYDLIHAYGSLPALPLMAGSRYVALEHGTLRTLPFENSDTGRLTALAYHKAAAVFVTNSDCYRHAQVLASKRARFLPHPYDEKRARKRLRGANELRSDLCRELEVDWLVFFPTRHDWVTGKGFADKGNDQMLRAFVKLRRAGLKVGIVCCAWGRNVLQSQTLMATAGVSSAVRWCPPLSSIAFERYMAACDVVADQFVLGAFGGVVFRALGMGRPVCTYLRTDDLSEMFGRAPPVLNCRTDDEIYVCLSELFRSSVKLRCLEAAGVEWMRQYHSGKETLRIQLEVYQSLCDEA